MAHPAIYRFLHRLIADLERDLDSFADVLESRARSDCPVRLLGYAGYRNARAVRVKGRVVRHEQTRHGGDGLTARLRAMLAIYNSKELAGVTVGFEHGGQTHRLITDEEGYFDFDIAIDAPLPETTRWEQGLLSTPDRKSEHAVVKVPILAPGADQHWGVISDIDDTVIETGATDFIRNWRRVLVERPAERLAVPGAASFYKMIARDHAAPARPFFYVSSSPWNLYGFITEFMELNAIPHGPMFLKDYGIDRDQLIHPGHEEHKLEAIRQVLGFYPEFRFLLIGDNGQRDVAVYRAIVEEFGARIAAVFIRDVDGSCREGPEGALLRKIEARGVPTFCGAGLEAAAETFAALGLDRPLETARAAAVQPAQGT